MLRPAALVLSLAAGAFLFSGCGLPQLFLLNAPVVEHEDGGGNALRSNVVAFRTPSDVTGITGYSLWYKVYCPTGDDALQNDDRNHFNPDLYDLLPGDSMPRQRGFTRAGIDGNAPSGQFTISHQLIGGASLPVYIDFNPTNTADISLRQEPVVATGFDNAIGPIGPLSECSPLTRGYVDPVKNDNQFRRFVSDWLFDNGTGGELANDGDLVRPPADGTGSQLSDFNGHDAIPGLLDSPNLLRIAIIVYSYGWDPGNPKLSYSIPIHLGYVEYGPPVYPTSSRY